MLDRIRASAAPDGDCLIWKKATRGGRPVITINGKLETVTRWLYGQLAFPLPTSCYLKNYCGRHACILVEPAHNWTHPVIFSVDKVSVRAGELAATRLS